MKMKVMMVKRAVSSVDSLLWGRRRDGSLTACIYCASHVSHVARFTRVVVGKGRRSKRGNDYGQLFPATCARALFWAWPNSPGSHVWPRPGGSCRCTKVGVL